MVGLVDLALIELLKRRLVRTFAVTSPAAGADWTATIPSAEVWDILAVEAQLVTSAAVANRTPALALDDGVLEFARVPAVNVQAAGLTWRYVWNQSIGYSPASGVVQSVGGIPDDASLPGGYRISAITGLLDVADQWSKIVILARQWEPARTMAEAAWLAQRGGLDAFPASQDTADEVPGSSWEARPEIVAGSPAQNSGVTIPPTRRD